jgi:hypothetical protein
MPCSRRLPPRGELSVLAVACLLPWYWLADLGARAGMPCVLGQALSMQTMPGGTATHDPIAAHKIAVVLAAALCTLLMAAVSTYQSGTLGLVTNGSVVVSSRAGSRPLPGESPTDSPAAPEQRR